MSIVLSQYFGVTTQQYIMNTLIWKDAAENSSIKLTGVYIFGLFPRQSLPYQFILDLLKFFYLLLNLLGWY